MAKTAQKSAKKTAAKKSAKKGPKDRSYVNRSQRHEVAYEKKRKTPAKKFGSGKSAKKTSAKKRSR